MKTIKTNLLKKWMLSGILFLSVSILANASGIIKGRVIDNQNQPVEYATATLINPETNEIVVGDMCDSNGEFILENVKPGEYILSVRNVGFKGNEAMLKLSDSNKYVLQEKPIVLNEAIQELPELEVVANTTQNNKPADEKEQKKS